MNRARRSGGAFSDSIILVIFIFIFIFIFGGGGGCTGYTMGKKSVGGGGGGCVAREV